MYDLGRLRVLRELAHRGTLAAVATALSYSPSTISQQLSQLERLGYVRRDPKRPRAIEVVNPFEEEEAERANAAVGIRANACDIGFVHERVPDTPVDRQGHIPARAFFQPSHKRR